MKGLLQNKSGLTLVEVLISFFILSIGILSVLMYFTSATASTGLARDMTTATTHAEYILEEMRTRATLAEIEGVNWPSWAGTNNLNTLPDESIAVAYATPGANPLNITVTVNWTTKKRAHNISLQTEMTK